MSIEKDTEKEAQWQNFKQMVADMTDNKFYEEVVGCRMIAFGSCEGDDKDYFFDLVNAYSENKYKAKKEVNEEELDKLADEYSKSIWTNPMFEEARLECVEAFKAGYRKSNEKY